MTREELAWLVTEMRSAQREYFKIRSRSTLAAAKHLERQVDLACRQVLRAPREQPLLDLIEARGREGKT